MLTPTLMRRLDAWIGAPVCGLLTATERLRGALAIRGSRRVDPCPRRALFIELAEMGCLVLAWPAVQLFRATYPDCAVSFLVFRHLADVVTLLGLASKESVLTIDPSTLGSFVRDTVDVLRAIRAEPIDTVVNLEIFTRFSTILAYLSGARWRVGFHPYRLPGLYIGGLLTHKVIYNPHLHTAQSYLALVRALSEPADRIPFGKTPAETLPRLPRLDSPPERRARLLERLKCERPALAAAKRIIVVNPNASQLLHIRRWPLAHYAHLVSLLVKERDTYVVLTGAAGERDDARYIVEQVRSDQVIDLTGRTTLGELVDLFYLADLLISNDSGPAHLAALTPIRILVLFGPESPELYRPLSERCTVLSAGLACSPCVSAFNLRQTPCRDNQCLKLIDPLTVYAETRRLLAH